MLLYFVRHGQTDHNLRGIIQGQLDTSLNDHGRLEARVVGQYLGNIAFIEAWSSDLSRARETAEIIAESHEGLAIRTDPGLRERHLGSLQGKKGHLGKPLPKDVESGNDFRARMIRWFQSFLASHLSAANAAESTDPEPTILIVSHGAWLGSFLSVLVLSLGFKLADGVDGNRNCLNTSIMRVRCWADEGEKWHGTVLSWGEVEHLAGMMDQERLAVQDDVK
ncbi:histidine phosphatase superfamily [Naematelia encephala]|uniref:Histidine phosphatase superfamily n=1 Tax=Naematelia encephala TaxID=71784 RepID=A0A1Y2AQM5_9TREE|nr:histidine phosphatase superfamily [Naematelia encephala]